jgi:hypothetical protein
MAKTTFEDVFKAFVVDFGGELVPEDEGRSADYVFRQYNIVAELKCLVDDQTAETSKKLSAIIKERVLEQRRAVHSPTPDPNVRLIPITSAGGETHHIPFDEQFQQAWINILNRTFERHIRGANQQIRATKKRLCLPSAHGVLLLFNQGNPLHSASPEHAGRLIGEVIQKSGRFPHIQGLVYFSLHVPTLDEQTQKTMPFWFPAQVRGDSVEAVQRFQQALKEAWFEFIERVTGATVVSHRRETGWPE